MTSCFSQAACICALFTRKLHRVISRLFHLTPPAVEWPQHHVYLDEDGAFHLLDVDAYIDRDGWRLTELDPAQACANGGDR